MSARLEKVGHLWQDLHAEPASLEAAVQKLSRAIPPEEWQLGAGRSRRKGKPRKQTH